MKNWMLGCTAMALAMLATAQTVAPTKVTPDAARRDAPAAVDLTKKGVATGLPPAAAAKAKAKSKADAAKGIKPVEPAKAGTAVPKEPAPAGAAGK